MNETLANCAGPDRAGPVDLETVRRLVSAWFSESVVGLSVLAETPGVHRVVRATLGGGRAGKSAKREPGQRAPGQREPGQREPGQRERVLAPSNSLVVKCFAEPLRVDPLKRLVSWAGDLGTDSVIRLGSPLLIDVHARVVVSEDFGNARLDQLVPLWGRGDSRVLDLLHDVGRSLGEIQRLDPVGLPVMSLRDNLDELVAPHPLALAEYLPDRAPLIIATLHKLIEAERAWTPFRPVVSHRDFHLRQILRLGSQLGVVDWDLVAAGDPAFDVSYLLTYLETHDLDPTGEASDAFMRGYRSTVGPIDGEFARRLEVYRTFNLLRRACRRWRLADTDWERECHRMLDLLESESRPNRGT